MTTTTERKRMKKITRNTIKAFIRYARQDLYIRNLTKFDGMTDSVGPAADNAWHKAEVLPINDWDNVNTLGIKGAWFVGPHGSKDYFSAVATGYGDDDYYGYKVSNCCGSFEIAVKRPVLWKIPGQGEIKKFAFCFASTPQGYKHYYKKETQLIPYKKAAAKQPDVKKTVTMSDGRVINFV